MKKAILGTGIGWGILCIILAIVFFVLGANATDPQVIQQAQQQPGVTPEQAQAAAQALQYLLIVSAIFMVLSAIYSFVLIALRNSSIGKGGGIALGVIGIVIGATLPSVFFLVDSAKNR